MVKFIRKIDRSVEVKQDSVWTLIMRTDYDFVVQAIVKRFGVTDPLRKIAIHNLYIEFCEQLFKLLLETCSKSEGQADLHIYDNDEIERLMTKAIGVNLTLNLDPHRENDAFRFPFSRGFSFNGDDYKGQVLTPEYANKPGYLDRLLSRISGQEILIVEDCIFTGQSMLELDSFLVEHGVKVAGVVTGFHIRGNQSLPISNINPVVLYYTNDANVNIYKKLDLCDPGDFLFAGRGLVVSLFEGDFRVPYFLPFVKPSARVGFDSALDIGFSEELISLNIEYYEKLEMILQKRILIDELDRVHREPVRAFMNGATPVVEALERMLAKMETTRTEVNRISALVDQKRASQKI